MASKLSRFQRIREQVQALLREEGLVRAESGAWFHRLLHFGVMVWKSFSRNRCPVRAAALAYVTLLALIPMLAVVMSITSSVLKKQGEDRIRDFIQQFVADITPPGTLSTTQDFSPFTSAAPQANPGLGEASGTGASLPPNSTKTRGRHDVALRSLLQGDNAVEARDAIARHIYGFIQNTRSAELGLTGTALLIFTAISMLSRIETTFNDIWGVPRGRSWFQRIVLYWGVLSLAPILLVAALGLATGPHLHGTRQLLTTMPFVGTLLFGLLPILVLCLTFAAFYILMPNTKVDWRAALVGGAVAGLLFHLNNVGSVLYVSRVVTNFKIYGSLALVPVFMIGLYFAWVILLLGSQVAYAFQNRAAYLEEKQLEAVNQRTRELIALCLMTSIGARFARGEAPSSLNGLAEELAVPTRLIREIMRSLCSARLAIETAGGETAYLPARPLEAITVHDVLLSLRAEGGRDWRSFEEPAHQAVCGEFGRVQEAERQAAASVNLLALVNRAQRVSTEPASAILEPNPRMLSGV